MVKVRDDQPISMDGSVNLETWLKRLSARTVILDEPTLLHACRLARRAEDEAIAAENIWSKGTSSFRTGLEMAEILAGLNLDQDTLIAAVLYRSVREQKLPLETVRDQFGPDVAKLIDGVLRMAAIQLNPKLTRESVLGQVESQADQVRRMLVALVNDVRVALLKIAERTCAIRAVKEAPVAKRYRVAREVFDLFAPLAHRLGIGHIKWELEDLSFRYLYPIDYRKIAALLDEKRLVREAFMVQVIAHLEEKLIAADIANSVAGRAKHIYSIWRKMQQKNINFSQVYDIRAVRILVDDVRDCYSALGIVHALWRNIPREFDDYIAAPKPNGYQSLHTAVIGPEGKIIEVQIRTHQMHEDAELGVCAHWLYKGTDNTRANQSYEDKMAWLRQVLAWHDELQASGENLAVLQHEVVNDRIYALTPEGHVVDLPASATPLDFAYRIHTEVGHACRGAKVNGRMVALNHVLQTGDQIEILTSKTLQPSRDWLNHDLGYLHTSRARAKVAAWFKEQDREQNIMDGRATLQREVKRFGLQWVDLKAMAAQFNVQTEEDLMAALGSGDVRTMQVIHALEREQRPVAKIDRVPRARPRNAEQPDLFVRGVGQLMSQMAGCCKPLPGDAIVGYITLGRGVSVHREDCVKLLQLHNQEPNRIIEVSWGGQEDHVYPIDLLIIAYDRKGLLRDIMMVLANTQTNVLAVNTLSDPTSAQARMQLTVEIESLDRLGTLLSRIQQIPNVNECRRVSEAQSK